MTQGVQDNRGFYRIQDQVILFFEVVEEEQMAANDAEFALPVSPEFELLNKLHALDMEANAALRSIAEKDKNIAAYLKTVNQKVELLAQVIAESNVELEDWPVQEVTLSEGGLSFNNKKTMKMDTLLALKLVLLPSYIGLPLYGRVVNCNEHIKGDYLINLVFENLGENDRQLIARHVLQCQARERREEKDDK